MKALSIILIAVMLALISCATVPQNVQPKQQEILIKIQGVDAVKIEKDTGGVSSSMEVHNPAGELSQLSFTSGNKAFIKIFSGLSVADVTRLWNDLIILEHDTEIRDVQIFINSPGGDAFAGLALADQIERAKRKGFEITAHASGIIASAAVPVFAVCNVRIIAPGCILMVHEAALWKWPGRETASDIRSQNELMVLLRERYIGMLADNSNLSREKWEELEKKTTWFNAEQALLWGLADIVE